MSSRFVSVVKSLSTRNIDTMEAKDLLPDLPSPGSGLGVDELDVGPRRFASPETERSVKEQIESLTEQQRKTFYFIKRKWKSRTFRKSKKNGKRIRLGDITFLNFVRFCDPDEDEKNVWTFLKRSEDHYFRLSVKDVESQLLTKTLFPVPGLKTRKGGNDVFYMRPFRYSPKTTATQDIIDNLAYVMNHMAERTEHASTNGIAFLANMEGWTSQNFSLNYCYQFMSILQGSVTPAKVSLFLIVNPPDWFGSVWQIMKPMLSETFRLKVRIIPDMELALYLQDDFEEYLPDEMAQGKANTNAIVRDYVAYRLHVEGVVSMSCSTSTSSAIYPISATS